jgi:hypothetical protein
VALPVIEEVGKMPTLLEEVAPSFSSTSMFDVGRSMFDVQIPLFPNN